MLKEVLLDMVIQNEFTNSFAFNKLTPSNANYRLNEQTSSAGFIYRHIGELMNLFGTFFGVPTDVKNTTMGKTYEGERYNLEESKALVQRGYEMLKQLVENTADAEWLDQLETPFFGKVSKARLFAHILFHNSHHAGQISLTLARGKILASF